MKNCLIIAPYFPPLGGVGVQRITKFAKYMPKYDWNPIVVTPTAWTSKMVKDQSMMEDVAKDMQIYRPFFCNRDFFFPGDVRKLLNKIKETDTFPDNYVTWLPAALKCIENILRTKHIDLIFITVPSFSFLKLVPILHDKYGIPIIIDFRDPYSFNIYQTAESNRKHRPQILQLEQEAIEKADGIVCITPFIFEHYCKLYPTESHKFIYIPNGYDEDDFQDFPKTYTKPANAELTLGFQGSVSSILPLGPITDAVLAIKQKHNIDVLVNLATGTQIKRFKKEFTLLKQAGLLRYHGFVNHKDNIRLFLQSDVLLMMLVKGEHAKGIFSAKILEYLRANKPILLLHEKHSSLAELLSSTGTGITVDIEDTEEIQRSLLDLHEQKQTGRFEFNPNWNEIRKFDIRTRTENLTNFFIKTIQKI